MLLIIPTDISVNGFSGANLQQLYQLNNIPSIQGTSLDGSGQTLVIVDLCGLNTPDQILNDANQYFNENAIKPLTKTRPQKNSAIINPDGTPFTNCPGASSFSDVIQTLIHNHFSIGSFSNAYVISNSWSDPEIQDPGLEATLMLAAVYGISVNFSTGDCGDNTYIKAGRCEAPRPSSPQVNYPSISDFVTAVSATSVFVDANDQYAFETVWGNVTNKNGSYVFDGGTGGGISQYYGPVSWQSSISHFIAGGYGLISDFGNRRLIPDIAMLGAP